MNSLATATFVTPAQRVSTDRSGQRDRPDRPVLECRRPGGGPVLRREGGAPGIQPADHEYRACLLEIITQEVQRRRIVGSSRGSTTYGERHIAEGGALGGLDAGSYRDERLP